ncbi:MAG: repeat-containing protein [Chthonomonadaceae bacterium]|nr:repeat-containing protein [Chthonomonadaceae bacterium]
MSWLVPWVWILQACMLSGAPDTQPASSPAPQIAFRVGHRSLLFRIVFQHDRPMVSVAFSPDGRLLAAGSEDETLRYCHVRTGALLLTTQIFLPRDTHTPSAWISYTPEGYYEGSSDIKDYLRWQVGDRLLPAERFEKRYHRPDRVQAALSPSRIPVVAHISGETTGKIDP